MQDKARDFSGLAGRTLYEQWGVEPQKGCQQASNDQCNPEIVYCCQGSLQCSSRI